MELETIHISFYTVQSSGLSWRWQLSKISQSSGIAPSSRMSQLSRISQSSRPSWALLSSGSQGHHGHQRHLEHHGHHCPGICVIYCVKGSDLDRGKIYVIWPRTLTTCTCGKISSTVSGKFYKCT
jgi:hypothetical protein